MASVSLNSTSASALSVLTGSTAALEKTQKTIATGKSVDSAADNPAYWSIATTMKADNLSMSSMEDATALSSAVTDTAAFGLQQATDIVSDIQAKLISAKAVGADKSAINGDISQLKDQLTSTIQSASFNGQNLLQLGAGQSPKIVSMVSSVGTDGNGNLSVNVTSIDTAKTTLISQNNANDGILTRSNIGISSDGNTYDYQLLKVVSGGSSSSPTAVEIALSNSTSNAEIDGMVSATNSILSSLTDASAAIGTSQNSIKSNSKQLQNLQDLNSSAIAKLTGANMGHAFMQLMAQKAQQQLQTEGLNIANSDQRNVTKLFM
ncbi:flagellar hook associated protein [Allorhizobium sp. BGMRC 0089]|uniref:flagellin N-terminal helical domain-containing protein n=1 Tax=Allorhizobium sonneratiae TaxID=2934936 RepID=UPI002033B71E|nr:flagellin [Allorhizobium sonneratiae]MCM2291204.1 flagellar hook associated protein [Allorhizobium sonneratiae]